MPLNSVTFKHFAQWELVIGVTICDGRVLNLRDTRLKTLEPVGLLVTAGITTKMRSRMKIDENRNIQSLALTSQGATRARKVLEKCRKENDRE